MIFKRLNVEIKIIEKDNILFPNNLKILKDCPEKIYLLGNENILNGPSISIVGTRNSTELGNKIASNISEALSKNDLIIVSGAADGIDSQAHISSSKIYKTIAYVAGGFNNILRDERLRLAKEIISSGGTIISEYDLDYPVQKYMFLCRNRLIAAHSNATIVIEAPLKSGALNTAKQARTLNKPLFVIPWNIDYETGKGCNKLIKDGAKLLTSYKDVLNELSIIPQISINEYIDELSPPLNIENEFIHYYNYIRDFSPVSINDICTFFKSIPISDINSDLLLMELNGYIKQDSFGNYSVINSS